MKVMPKKTGNDSGFDNRDSSTYESVRDNGNIVGNVAVGNAVGGNADDVMPNNLSLESLILGTAPPDNTVRNTARSPREERNGNVDSGTELRGTVEGILFRSDDSGYIVATLTSDKEELYTVVGVMPDIDEGDLLTASGRWENNAKYGRQFRVLEYRREMPTGIADIERYLASGTIRGIGLKTARKIVSVFGEDTVDVIENHPEWLAQIPGITRKRADEISEEFKAKTDIRATVTFFRDYFGPALTMRIYKQFGSHSIEIAKDNPYRLCDEIRGISFDKADAMAINLGLTQDAPERVIAGVRYVLMYNAMQNGHVCLPAEKLIEASSATLDVGQEEVTDAIKRLVLSGRLIAESVPGREDKLIYDKDVYNNEKAIADKLISLDRGGVSLGFDDIEAFIRKEEISHGLSYADEQKKAIYDALNRGVLILTGGPGTGKTTVVTALIDIFESIDFDVALAAPTGRAAKRMTEATGREAKTVHRLLEVDFGDGDGASDGGVSGLSSGRSSHEKNSDAPLSFKRNESNYLDEQVFIVDEASMLDCALTASLLRAIRPGSRLILIGDSDQLPSVGSGNVLHDVLESHCLPTVCLTHIFRQAEMSLIVTNAHAINRGEMPQLDARDSDFFFMQRTSDAEIAYTIADLCAHRLPRAYGESEVVQVVSPTRRGRAGTVSLNNDMQRMINPPDKSKREYRHRDTVFRDGDKVMQVRNNYELCWERYGHNGQGIFNGDIGKITHIYMGERYMDIDFDGRRVMYEFSDLDDLELAYAITVHKSQGSEYPTVVIPVGDIPPALCTRNLLYTAVTRAQKRAILVGSVATVAGMVENARPAMRYTGLARRICESAGTGLE